MLYATVEEEVAPYTHMVRISIALEVPIDGLDKQMQVSCVCIYMPYIPIHICIYM